MEFESLTLNRTDLRKHLKDVLKKPRTNKQYHADKATIHAMLKAKHANNKTT